MARKPYSTAQLPYDAIYKAIQYSRKAIQCTYRKLYSTAGKPYSAIQGAVQDGSKAIQYGSIAIRCHIQSHTVQQKSHTVYIQKAIHEKR